MLALQGTVVSGANHGGAGAYGDAEAVMPGVPAGSVSVCVRQMFVVM